MNISEKRLNEFYSKISKTEGCWNWIGYKDRKGYGGFFVDGKMQRAHRVSYIIHKGLLKDHVLHSCDNPSCVNPAHLSEGTHQQNMKEASERKRFPASRKTHCKRGHELTPDNLYSSIKARSCKKCSSLRWYERYKFKNNPPATP